MAHRMWKHGCGCEKYYSTTSAENCPRCGRPGEFAGWSRSVVEQMGHHKQRTGYPFSKNLAKHLLPQLKRECPDCRGTGLMDVNHGQDYRSCDRCNGDGGLPNFPPEVMRRYQRLAY